MAKNKQDQEKERAMLALTDTIRARIEGTFTIGEFNISYDKDDENRIWIYHFTGEGGGFNKKEFEKVISKFYNDNF